MNNETSRVGKVCKVDKRETPTGDFSHKDQDHRVIFRFKSEREKTNLT